MDIAVNVGAGIARHQHHRGGAIAAPIEHAQDSAHHPLAPDLHQRRLHPGQGPEQAPVGHLQADEGRAHHRQHEAGITPHQHPEHQHHQARKH